MDEDGGREVGRQRGLARPPVGEVCGDCNAKNYRRHPKGQIAALKGSLSEIGWIAPIVARRHSDAVGVQPTKGGANPTRPLLRMTKLP